MASVEEVQQGIELLKLQQELGKLSYDAAQVQMRLKALNEQHQKLQTKIACVCNEITALKPKKKDKQDG